MGTRAWHDINRYEGSISSTLYPEGEHTSTSSCHKDPSLQTQAATANMTTGDLPDTMKHHADWTRAQSSTRLDTQGGGKAATCDQNQEKQKTTKTTVTSSHDGGSNTGVVDLDADVGVAGVNHNEERRGE